MINKIKKSIQQDLATFNRNMACFTRIKEELKSSYNSSK